MIQYSQNALSHVLQFSFEKYAMAFCDLYKRIS